MSESRPSLEEANLSLLEEQVIDHGKALGALQRGQISLGNNILSLRRELSEETQARKDADDAVRYYQKSIDKKLTRLSHWGRHPAITLAATIIGTAGAVYMTTLAMLHR